MNVPKVLTAIEEATDRLGFPLASDRKTGSLLRALAASKPGGRFLEIGTGTGLSACWLLDGMDAKSQLTTVDKDEDVLRIARAHLGDDPRITISGADGGEFLEENATKLYDLIFADALPGKFSHLDQTLALLAPGGLYVIDDLLPQPFWPEDHAPKVPKLVDELKSRKDLVILELAWSTGLIIATKVLPRP